jgi:ATP-dependent RNA helicase DDX24/MAK5
VTSAIDCYVSEDDDEATPAKRNKRAAGAKSAKLRAELQQLLAQPLITRGVSTRYITSGSVPIADDLLAGDRASIVLNVLAYPYVDLLPFPP